MPNVNGTAAIHIAVNIMVQIDGGLEGWNVRIRVVPKVGHGLAGSFLEDTNFGHAGSPLMRWPWKPEGNRNSKGLKYYW